MTAEPHAPGDAVCLRGALSQPDVTADRVARPLQPGTSGDRGGGPVTGSCQRTRRARTTRSQRTTPRDGSFPGTFFFSDREGDGSIREPAHGSARLRRDACERIERTMF